MTAAGIFDTNPSGPGLYKIAERISNANNLPTTMSYLILGNNVKQTGGTIVGTNYTASLTLAQAYAVDLTLTSVIGGQTLTRTDTSSLLTSCDTIGIFAPGTRKVSCLTMLKSL